MRLLMLVFNQINQGTYWRALNLGKSLARMGHSPTLIATSRNQRAGVREYFLDGVEIVETPDLMKGALRSGWDIWNTINRISWSRKRSFDLLHAFEARPTVIFPALAYLRHHPIPFIMDWADWFGKGGSVEERSGVIVKNLLRPVETFFEENYRTMAHGTTVISSTLRQKAVNLGVVPETILYLKNGADTHNTPLITIDDARTQLGFSSTDRIIGYVGSIFRKDAEFMVQAFENVLRQQPQIKLIIAGYCPYDVRQAVSKPENVIQTGYVETSLLQSYLSACDLFWLPLRNSNANCGRFPYKLTDYLSTGRPIIATAVGDIPALFEDGIVGYLSPDQPEVFAERTVALLQDRELREKMGLAARRLAEYQFSWDHLAVSLESFYQEIASRFRGRAR